MRLTICLLATSPSLAEPEPDRVLIVAEGPALRIGDWELNPEVIAASAADPAAARRAPEARARPLRWDQRGDQWSAQVVLGPVLFDLLVEPITAEVARLTVRTTPGSTDPVGVLALGLTLPAAPWAVDRAYRKTAGPAHQDRFTPQLSGGDRGWLWAAAEAVEVRDGAVRIELNHPDNHPFRPFRQCDGAWTRAAELNRLDLSATPAQPDEVQVLIGLGEPPPLVPLRYPDGYRAALVFSDHADQADDKTLPAVLWGDSEADREAGRGLLGHGLTYTKTVFAEAKRRHGDLRDPAFRRVVRQAMREDVEIGAHSGSDGAEEAEDRARHLAVLARYRSRTWIDHQPITNCEGLLAQGWRQGPWHVTPDLQAFGYDYAWSDEDREEPVDGINLLDPARPTRRPAILYPHPLAGGIWLFPSQWRAVPRSRWVDLYRDQRLARLAADRGVHIAHTYLDAAPGPGPGAWSLLERSGSGWRLHDAVDDRFAAMAKMQEEHLLWVGTIGRLGDHLRGMAALRWTPVGAGRWAIENPSPKTLYGASFRSDGGWPAVDGVPLDPVRVREESDGLVFDVDLRPGRTILETL